MKKSSPDIEIVEGITFELIPIGKSLSKGKFITLRKNREYTNRYLSLADEFQGCRCVEVGVDQGGSTSFFTKLLKPEKMLAFELSKQPVETVTRFLAHHDPQGRVEIHWGVDQSDRVEIPILLEKAFREYPLDIVIDDASHLLAPSTATFEMIFPRLRPGGLYILEDWSCAHLRDRALKQRLEQDPHGELAQKFETALIAGHKFEPPMSVLICQLLVAAGYNKEWISDLRVADGFCEVRRGSAEIEIDTPIEEYLGPLGQQMFEKLTT